MVQMLSIQTATCMLHVSVTAAAVRLHGQQQPMTTFRDEVRRDGWQRICPAGLNTNPRKIWLLLGGGLAVSAAAQQTTPTGCAFEDIGLQILQQGYGDSDHLDDDDDDDDDDEPPPRRQRTGEHDEPSATPSPLSDADEGGGVVMPGVAEGDAAVAEDAATAQQHRKELRQISERQMGRSLSPPPPGWEWKPKVLMADGATVADKACAVVFGGSQEQEHTTPVPTFTIDVDAIEYWNGANITDLLEFYRTYMRIRKRSSRLTASGNRRTPIESDQAAALCAPTL